MGWLGKLLQNVRDRRAAYLEQKNIQVADEKPASLIPARNGRHGMAVSVDPFAFQAAHRRLAWMLRMSAGMNIAQLASIVVLVSVIAEMVPLKEKVPFWIIPANEDVVRFQIKPVVEDVNAFDVELEGKARRYVKARLEIDPVTQKERMQEISRMTERSEWQDFHDEWIKSGKIADAIKDGLDREIIIESSNKVASLTGDYKFAIDFTRIDRRDDRQIGEPVHLRAYLSMVTSPKTVTLENKYINPFGVTVTDMILRTRGSS